MKFLKYTLFAILAIFLIALIAMPRRMEINKSIVINAHPDVVFARVNVVKNWEPWSPWAKMDPKMKVTYTGPESGVGASYSWVSDKQEVGSGKLEITEVKKNELSKQKMTMGGGEEGASFFAWFTMKKTDDGKIELSWLMDSGEYGFFDIGSRIFCTLYKGTMEDTFDQGLADIKKISEEIKNPYTLTIKKGTMSSENILAVMDSCSTENSEIKAAFGKCFGKLMGYLEQNKIQMMGAPLSIAHTWDETNKKYVFEAGIPVPTGTKASDGITYKTINGGDYVLAELTGDYAYLMDTHLSIDKFIKENNLTIIGSPIEKYLNDPTTVKPEEVKTLVAYPVK